MNPPLPSEISAFEPPSPLEFPVTFRGGGGYGYFLEPHNGNSTRWLLHHHVHTKIITTTKYTCTFNYN